MGEGIYSREWLSEKEIKTLFALPALNSRDLLLIRTLYFGAFRVSEVLNSKREDYRHENEYFYLLLREQKTEKKNWEVQPIKASIFGEINRYCNDNGIKSQDFVFQSNRNKKLSYITAYQMIKKSASLAGIEKKITTHSFRRSRATHLLENGMDLAIVSRFLRHKKLDTTIKYLKISKKTLYNDMEAVDKKLLWNELN